MINNQTFPLSPHEALAILQWYQSVGVDEATDNHAQPKAGWAPSMQAALSEAPLPESSHAPNKPVSPQRLEISPSGQREAVAEARQLADQASNLAELKEALLQFHGCALRKTAMNTVFADGNPESPIMFVGEAPGGEEDRQGIPFCGPSGQLLDSMLAQINLMRTGQGKQSFYITNTLFWRPPGNRQPTPEEIEICRPFVEKHIALVNPKLLVAVGGTATKALLHQQTGITRLRGKIMPYENGYLTSAVPTHIIYHPSFLLRQPAAKRQTWGDLLQLKEAINAI